MITGITIIFAIIFTTAVLTSLVWGWLVIRICRKIDNQERKVSKARQQRDRALHQYRLLKERYDDDHALLHLPKGCKLLAFKYVFGAPPSRSRMLLVRFHGREAFGESWSWKQALDNALQSIERKKEREKAGVA